MKSDHNEKLILFAGLSVLAFSLVVPLAQRIANDYDIADVATRAAELKKDVLTAAASDKTLGEHVGRLVDGLSPDAALAEASLRGEKSMAPNTNAVRLTPGGPIGELKVVAEWAEDGRAKMRVDEAARKKQWTWEAPSPSLASPSDQADSATSTW